MVKQQETNLTVSRSLLQSLVPREKPVSEEYQLVRPDDQVYLQFKLINGFVDKVRNVILPLLAGEPIIYEIWTGSQHRVEAPYAVGNIPADPAVGSRLAGDSRIVIEIPAKTPFTVATLLDLAAYSLVLDDRALSGTDKNEQEPDASVTAIEVPTSLVLSPVRFGRFVAETEPVTHGNVTELWRARLARFENGRAIEPPAATPRVRAIWQRSEDPNFEPPRPVDSEDRRLLVEQTTGDNSDQLLVNQLWLSSQGAFIDVEGEWAKGTLLAYRHRVITGRDLHVEVIKRGYLTPFGHPASVTTLTERDYVTDKSGETTAVLFQEEFLTIGSHDVDMTTAPYVPYQGRGTPFLKLTATDPGSGTIGSRQVVLADGTRILETEAYVMTRAGEDLRINFNATDRSGQTDISFDMPVVFVNEVVAYKTGTGSVPNILSKWFMEPRNQEFATGSMSGQEIAWADPPTDASNNRAGSVQTTNRISFGLDLPPAKAGPDLESSRRPAFYPAVRSAHIVDLAASTSYGGTPPELEVNIAQRYLDNGSGGLNRDLGYLDLSAPTVVMPTIDAPGMMSLGMNVETFGQLIGGGIDVSAGSWNPIDALADLLGEIPRLLGSINLVDILDSINLKFDGSDRGLPSMSVDPVLGSNGIPTGVCFHFQWEPEINSFPRSGDKTFVVTRDFGGKNGDSDDKVSEIPADAFGDRETHALLDLKACSDGSPTFEIALERFALLLPPKVPVVAMLFERLRYLNAGGKGSVTTDIGDWFFINQLGWLEPIKDFLLDIAGLGEPMFEGGIFIDFDLPVPGLSLGVVGIHGIELGLDINLPDKGGSSMGFNLSSQEDPFIVTIMGFGGNGSFVLEVDSRKIVYIKGTTAVMFELSVNVFIVSAAISVSLGTFIIYEIDAQDQGEVSLGAYATVAGAISIIGLVKISGSVTVALIYNVTSKVLRGVASITGEIDAVVFKGTATHDVEIEVALGGNSQRTSRLAAPTEADNSAQFGDRYDETQWSQYCRAFAA